MMEGKRKYQVPGMLQMFFLLTYAGKHDCEDVTTFSSTWWSASLACILYVGMPVHQTTCGNFQETKDLAIFIPD